MVICGIREGLFGLIEAGVGEIPEFAKLMGLEFADCDEGGEDERPRRDCPVWDGGEFHLILLLLLSKDLRFIFVLLCLELVCSLLHSYSGFIGLVLGLLPESFTPVVQNGPPILEGICGLQRCEACVNERISLLFELVRGVVQGNC